MTTTETTETADQPLLPKGMLACPSCGVAVPEPDDAGDLVIAYSVAVGPTGQALPGRRLHPVRLARCPGCRSLRDRAEALLAAHPRVVARRGTVVGDHVEAALIALAVLGLPAPVALPEVEVFAALDHLAGPGAGCRFIRRFMPSLSVPRDAYSVRPWPHVSDADRARLREGYGAILRERITRDAPPVPVPPPPLDLEGLNPDTVALAGACLMCGVGAVLVPALQVREVGVWRQITCSPASLGGRAAPAPVAGHVCHACYDAIRSAGIGPTAREQAVLAYLRASGQDAAADRLKSSLLDGTPPALPGWGALAYAASRAGQPAPPASTEPWSHLPPSVLR